MIKTSISNELLGAFFAQKTNTLIPTSSQCWLGVSTTTPTLGTNGDITNFTEPSSDTGYKRVRLGLYNKTETYIMDAPANAEIKNGTNFIFFNEATEGAGGFGTVTHFGLFASESGSTAPILTGALTTPVEVGEGKVLIFRPNDLKVSMA